MHRTFVFKLRANPHDRRRLKIALARWHGAFAEAMDRAGGRQKRLLKCLVVAKTKDGAPKRYGNGKPVLVIDGKAARSLVLECCQPVETHLHSSVKMSLVVAVEEQVKSWLGLRADWLKGDRKLPPPAFPSVAMGSDRQWRRRWPELLERGSQAVMTLEAENAWRADLLRGSRHKILPQYFGAASSGGPRGQSHCGLMKREDGRYFALLTLFGAHDPLGEPTRLASGRTGTCIANVRSPVRFEPTERARASIMVPLERGSGHGARRKRWERRSFARGAPKSAELVAKNGEYWLHVAFELPEPAPRKLTGTVLALQRGVSTLLAAVLVDRDGQLLAEERIEGRDLLRAVTAIRVMRAKKQSKGQPTSGDRRLGRITTHHLYSASHQIQDLACRYGARVVLLEDKTARKPNRFLAYKHFHRLEQILAQHLAQSGLPPPLSRELYGSRATCVECGWRPQRGEGTVAVGLETGGTGAKDKMTTGQEMEMGKGRDPDAAGLREVEAMGPRGTDRGETAAEGRAGPGGSDPGAKEAGPRKTADGAEMFTANQCGGCGRTRGEFHVAHLLALDSLRLSPWQRGERTKPPPLAEFIQALRQSVER